MDSARAAAGIGAATWVAALGAGAVGVGSLPLVSALLLLAVCVLVPLGLPLHRGGRRAAMPAAVLAAPAAVALLLPRGPVAVGLASPWAAGAAVLLALAVASWWLARPPGPWRVAALVTPRLVAPVAAAWLLVGAVWLVADRAGARPLGTADPFVVLTAVHFHHAGAVAATVVGTAWVRSPRDRLARTAALLVLVAPPVVGLGFLVLGALQVLGAVLLTAGTWAWAWWAWRRGEVAPRAARWALRLAGLAVVAPMLLAVQWAVGTNLGTPALSIPAMAATHGVANALGFGLLGLAGWRAATRRPVPARAAAAPRVVVRPSPLEEPSWSSPA